MTKRYDKKLLSLSRCMTLGESLVVLSVLSSNSILPVYLWPHRPIQNIILIQVTIIHWRNTSKRQANGKPFRRTVVRRRRFSRPFPVQRRTSVGPDGSAWWWGWRHRRSSDCSWSWTTHPWWRTAIARRPSAVHSFCSSVLQQLKRFLVKSQTRYFVGY